MEYYSKCNVCGKITCYTDKDLKDNNKQSLISGLAALSTIGNAVVGTKYDMYESSKFSNRVSSKIVDYSKCPSCGSKDIVLVTKKFAIFSNKVNGNYSIDDLIREANSYLDKNDFENAFCFSTMVLNEDEKNYEAYLIRLLSSYEVKSLEEINGLGIDYSDNQHFNDLLLVSSDTQKKKLLAKCNNSKYNYILTNSNSLLEQEDNVDIIEELEYYIKKLDNYDDKKSKDLLNGLDSKRKEILYKQGCEYLKLEDISELTKALDLFEELDNYKDSNDKWKKCKEKLNSCKKSHNKTVLITVICIIAVIFGFVILCIVTTNREKEKTYKEASVLVEKGKYIEAIKLYKELGNYKDSKEKKEKTESEIIYLKAEDYFDKGQFYSAYLEYEKINNYKDSNEKKHLSQLYYNIKNYNHNDSETFFNQNIENFKLINDESQIREIFVNKWLVGMLHSTTGLIVEIFNEDGTGYRPNAKTFKDLLWKTENGHLYYTFWSKLYDSDKSEFRKVVDGVYLLVSAKNKEAEYIFILYDSDIRQKLDLKGRDS